MEKIILEKINETMYVDHLENGLTIVFVPKPEFNKVNASVTTKFGSLNNHFILDGEEFEIIDGIAHFLEHKMFEKKDGDVFSKYSSFGGNANAYTSFDQTCYYFTCSSKFKENFDVLLSMMTSPYFTEETVEKEKGIIGEELKMYDDDSSWMIYYETLKNLYESHPLRIDIGGTIPSIDKITAEDLHFIYNTFYHPSNIIVTVVGNFDMDEAFDQIKSYYGPIVPAKEMYNIHTEDTEVFKKSSELKMDVNLSKCAVGYKQNFVLDYDYKREVAINIYLKMLFSRSSENYELLSNKGLYPTYAYSELDTTGFAVITSDVYSEEDFFDLVSNVFDSELLEIDFQMYKNKNIGSLIRTFNSVDSFSKVIIDSFVNEYNISDVIVELENLTFEEMLTYAKQLFNEDNRTQVTIKK